MAYIKVSGVLVVLIVVFAILFIVAIASQWGNAWWIAFLVITLLLAILLAWNYTRAQDKVQTVLLTERRRETIAVDAAVEAEHRERWRQHVLAREAELARNRSSDWMY